MSAVARVARTSAQVAGERGALPQRPERCAQRVGRPPRNVAGVGEPDGSSAVTQDDASGEGTKLQPLVVELSTSLGVGRVVELETAVEQVAVDLVGADASTDVVGRLEQQDVASALGQGAGGDQSRQAGSDHHDVGVRGSWGRHVRERRGWRGRVQVLPRRGMWTTPIRLRAPDSRSQGVPMMRERATQRRSARHAPRGHRRSSCCRCTSPVTPMGRSIPRTSAWMRPGVRGWSTSSHHRAGRRTTTGWRCCVSVATWGRPTGPRRLSWESVGGLEGVELLQWLMRWSDPQPLPLDVAASGRRSRCLLH